MSDIENKYKVRLVAISSLLGGQTPADVRAGQVAFDVTPTFSESRTAEYEALTPVHMPGSIQMYKRTNSRTFSVGARFVSRSMEDALKNMRYVQLLRAWMMPYFGKTDTKAGAVEGNMSSEESNAVSKSRIDEGMQLRGAPPDVLYLYAYASGYHDTRTSTNFSPVNINRVPVVITNLDITYPEDVDYIPVTTSTLASQETQPFPRRLDVQLTLAETHSPREYERFDLLAYKQGNLANF